MNIRTNVMYGNVSFSIAAMAAALGAAYAFVSIYYLAEPNSVASAYAPLALVLIGYASVLLTLVGAIFSARAEKKARNGTEIQIKALKGEIDALKLGTTLPEAAE